MLFMTTHGFRSARNEVGGKPLLTADGNSILRVIVPTLNPNNDMVHFAAGDCAAPQPGHCAGLRAARSGLFEPPFLCAGSTATAYF
jgi:hypothetical protein